MIFWPGIEGYNYPFQTPYATAWEWFIDGIGRGRARRCAKHGVKLFLEHKNSEPAMKILMRNIGMTLHVIHTLRAQGIDEREGEHGLAAPDHERRERSAEYAALLAAEGLLGHQHANSGWGTFDDDNMVGATAFMETLELAVELRRARLRRRTASGSASTSIRTPRTRSRPSSAQRAAVALHRLGRREDRRRRAARGPDAQGRRARLRARVRRARCVASTREPGGAARRRSSRSTRSTPISSPAAPARARSRASSPGGSSGPASRSTSTRPRRGGRTSSASRAGRAAGARSC